HAAERRGEAAAGSRETILARLRRDEKILEAARQDLVEAARLEHSVTAAAEWLLDNGYLVRTQVAEISRHWPSDDVKVLPAGPAGCPYIHDLATALVRHTGLCVTEENIADALRRYQEVAPLTIAELWSFPLVLRIALVGELAALASRVSHAQKLR